MRCLPWLLTYVSRHLATKPHTRPSSGKTISFPAVIADYGNGRYLVSMLGEDTSWVRNVRASGGARRAAPR
jgi:hypothetical protein